MILKIIGLLMEIKEIFYLIKKTRGTNNKLEIIKNNLNNELFIKCLKIIMNPDIKTGISRKFLLEHNLKSTPLFLEDNEIIKLIINKIENFNNKKESKLEIVSYYNFISKKDLLLSKVIYYLITKDCPIGIGDTLLRKIIFDFRDKFEIMLGSKVEIDNIDFKRRFILSQKLDGVNLTVIKKKNEIIFKTRQGKIISNLDALKRDYLKMNDGYYFGEAIYFGENYKSREELYKLTTGELNSKRENKKIKHYIFDYATVDEFENNNFKIPYLQTINNLVIELKEKRPNLIQLVEIVYDGDSKNDALKWLKFAKEKGWEGLMLRYASSIYEKKRSKQLIKLKPFNELDLKIIGYKMHKNEGLGSFIVKYKNGEVSIGSGYTKNERLEFWRDRDFYINKIMEVKYMEETEDFNGKKSLRFPIFLRMRLDKDEPNYT